jgi:hypothetical protein
MKRSFDTHLEDKRPSYEEVNEKAKANKLWTDKFKEDIFYSLTPLQRHIFRISPDIRVEAYRARLATIALPPEISLKITIATIIPLFPDIPPIYVLDIALMLLIKDIDPFNTTKVDDEYTHDDNIYGSLVKYDDYNDHIISNWALFDECWLVKKEMEFQDCLIDMVADEILDSEKWRSRVTPYLKIAAMSQSTSIADLWIFAMDMSDSQWNEVCSFDDEDDVLKTLRIGKNYCICSTMVMKGLSIFAPESYERCRDMIDREKDKSKRVVDSNDSPQYEFSRSSRNYGVMLTQFLRKHQPMAIYLIGEREHGSLLHPEHEHYSEYKVGDNENAYYPFS